MSANLLGGGGRYLDTSSRSGAGRHAIPFPFDALESIIGGSRAMRETLAAVKRIGPTNRPVLVRGETGTGKELVVRAIHACSRRVDGPLAFVNCASVPETLWESEFFGHERGAFTGADQQRVGWFEKCDGGTLVLDEVGDMPPAAQSGTHPLARVLAA